MLFGTQEAAATGDNPPMAVTRTGSWQGPADRVSNRLSRFPPHSRPSKPASRIYIRAIGERFQIVRLLPSMRRHDIALTDMRQHSFPCGATAGANTITAQNGM
jgi:hypothetical protein